MAATKLPLASGGITQQTFFQGLISFFLKPAESSRVKRCRCAGAQQPARLASEATSEQSPVAACCS